MQAQRHDVPQRWGMREGRQCVCDDTGEAEERKHGGVYKYVNCNWVSQTVEGTESNVPLQALCVLARRASAPVNRGQRKAERFMRGDGGGRGWDTGGGGGSEVGAGRELDATKSNVLLQALCVLTRRGSVVGTGHTLKRGRDADE